MDTCYRGALGGVCPVLRVLGLQHGDMVIRKQHKPGTSRPRGQKQHRHKALTFQESYGLPPQSHQGLHVPENKKRFTTVGGEEEEEEEGVEEEEEEEEECNEDYKGSRCEQFQLPSKFGNAGEAGLIAAVVIVALLILALLAVVIFYVRRMLKAKQQSQQNNQQPYWKSRAAAADVRGLLMLAIRITVSGVQGTRVVPTFTPDLNTIHRDPHHQPRSTHLYLTTDRHTQH
ncbi:hypothetical protein INR49_010787 [Caranx melampygus]|nr:hypothetical protein INR49_010787 [Caranx melampygus]